MLPIILCYKRLLLLFVGFLIAYYFFLRAISYLFLCESDILRQFLLDFLPSTEHHMS